MEHTYKVPTPVSDETHDHNYKLHHCYTAKHEATPAEPFVEPYYTTSRKTTELLQAVVTCEREFTQFVMRHSTNNLSASPHMSLYREGREFLLHLKNAVVHAQHASWRLFVDAHLFSHATFLDTHDSTERGHACSHLKAILRNINKVGFGVWAVEERSMWTVGAAGPHAFPALENWIANELKACGLHAEHPPGEALCPDLGRAIRAASGVAPAMDAYVKRCLRSHRRTRLKELAWEPTWQLHDLVRGSPHTSAATSAAASAAASATVSQCTSKRSSDTDMTEKTYQTAASSSTRPSTAPGVRVDGMPEPFVEGTTGHCLWGLACLGSDGATFRAKSACPSALAPVCDSMLSHGDLGAFFQRTAQDAHILNAALTYIDAIVKGRLLVLEHAMRAPAAPKPQRTKKELVRAVVRRILHPCTSRPLKKKYADSPFFGILRAAYTIRGSDAALPTCHTSPPIKAEDLRFDPDLYMGAHFAKGFSSP